MKAAEFIHKKLPRFTKPRFYYIYEQLLYMTISEMEKPKKPKKIKKKVYFFHNYIGKFSVFLSSHIKINV